jgi:hypothetical protein
MSSSYRIQAATGIHRGDREYQQDQVLLMAHPMPWAAFSAW